jgi:hypothetical protein
MVHLLLDARALCAAVSGEVHFVGDIGVSPHQRYGCLVQGRALGLALFQIRGYFCVAAEIVNIFEFAFGRLNGLAQQGDGFERCIQPLFALLQPVLDKHIWCCAA